MKIRFKFLVGDINWADYGGKWISQKLKDEFEFYYVLELINMHDATGDEDQDKYVVNVDLVSPSEATEEQWKSAMDCHGYTEDSMEWTPEMKVEVLHGYGACSQILTLSGNNYDKLMRQIKQELQEIAPSQELAKPKNAIGSTGYDFLKGDITAGLNRSQVVQVNQSELTSECWMIQIFGIGACESCEFKETSECGGQKIREKLLTEC